MFRAMVGKRSGAVIQQLLHKMLVDLVRDEAKAMAARSDAGSMPTEAVVQPRRSVRIADVVGEREDADAGGGGEHSLAAACDSSGEGVAALSGHVARDGCTAPSFKG